jgi:uncharacterized membrane protein YciS (DUF1049 family)
MEGERVTEFCLGMIVGALVCGLFVIGSLKLAGRLDR